MPTFSFLLRWINRIFRQPWSTDKSSSTHEQCYACNQFGPPVFHSTTCDPTHQPHWQALAGSSLVPVRDQSGHHRTTVNSHRSSSVLDPRSDKVRRWNRAILLARAAALGVDPLFFFALTVGGGGGGRPCIYVDGAVAAAVSVVRTCVDAVHLWHVWLQFRLAYVSRETLVVGCGNLVWDPRVIATRYLKSLNGLWFDVFVILPIPQLVYCLEVPRLLGEERFGDVMTLIQIIFLLQFFPKIYHTYCLLRRMRAATGYIFGSIWWGFSLNFVAYFLASHASGGYWYALAIRRIGACLMQQCNRSKKCNLSVSCSREGRARVLGRWCGGKYGTRTEFPTCLDEDGPFPYGIYQFALPLIACDSIPTKFLYCNLWGLMALSTMGNNLEPTSQVLEVVFSSCMVLGGLMLFTLLIGNIQVFLKAITVRRRKMEVRCRDMEWWMKRRQLPSRLRSRVRQFEQQRWSLAGGQDEMAFVEDLPDGLRRDIKRYLCLDLIKKAPLFTHLDDVILDNICDRVRPVIYSKGEKVITEGDPVQQMLFIVRGRIKRSQRLSKGTVVKSVLEPGSFFGDELLSWCLRIPFINRYPASTATFTCVKATEAFGLDANHLRYITDHFRYTFMSEKLKKTARYYSSNWRTWAAINIQFAWRRYVLRTRGLTNPVPRNGGSDHRLRHYAAMFLSLRPHDHLE